MWLFVWYTSKISFNHEDCCCRALTTFFVRCFVRSCEHFPKSSKFGNVVDNTNMATPTQVFLVSRLRTLHLQILLQLPEFALLTQMKYEWRKWRISSLNSRKWYDKKKSVAVTISSVLTARPFCWLKTYLPEKHGKSDVLTAYKWSVGLWSLLALGLS